LSAAQGAPIWLGAADFKSCRLKPRPGSSMMNGNAVVVSFLERMLQVPPREIDARACNTSTMVRSMYAPEINANDFLHHARGIDEVVT
jgi:hypothetical protein